MKTLKDYLHLYLGCKCAVKGYEGQYTLTGISYDDTVRQWWAYFENTEFGYVVIEEIKPYVRRLSDITEGEILDVACICYMDIFGRKPDISKMRKVYDVRNERLVLYEKVDGSVWRYGLAIYDGNIVFSANDSPLNVSQFMVAGYLLSKGLWIFGEDWFDSGLLVDANERSHAAAGWPTADTTTNL